QVPHDLLQACRIAERLFGRWAEIRDEIDALCLRCRTRRLERGFYYGHKINGFQLDSQFALDDARGIEKVFDDVHLRFRAALDDRSNFADSVSVHWAGAQHPRVAEDCGQKASAARARPSPKTHPLND